MAEDTAVLEQATAAVPEETPGEAVVETEVAETEAQATTETEAEEPASPFAGKSFDEIAQDPEVERVIKDRLAKHEESLRQRAQSEQAKALEQQQVRQYQQMRQQAAQLNGQWAANALREAADKAVEDGKPLDSKQIEGVAGWLSTRALIAANEEMVGVANTYLERYHSDFRVPQELVRAFNTAQANQDVGGMTMATLAILDIANRDKISRELRLQMERENAESTSKESKVDKERAAATAAKSAPKPISAAGTAPKARDTSDILADPNVSGDAKRQAFIAKYGFAP